MSLLVRSKLSWVATSLALAMSGCGSEGAVEDDGAAGSTNVALPDAGVPVDGCGMGFVHDGDGGCVAVLPSASCPFGQMAVPGDTTCRDVAPCGSGAWGDIPVASDTVFVDQSYVGASDGSMSQPFTTINEGLDAALVGATVAVAAGSYEEEVVLHDKPVALWGRCPSMVEIVGGAAQATILVQNSQGGAIRGVAVRASTAAFGIGVLDSQGFTIDQVWVHDTTERGIELQSFAGPVEVSISNSMVEQVDGVGIGVRGSELALVGSVVRDVAVGAVGTGRAIQLSAEDGVAARVVVQRSLFERNHEVGIAVFASELTFESSELRDMLPFDFDRFGHGFFAYEELGQLAQITLRQSAVERTLRSAVIAQGANVIIDATSIRDVSPELASGENGRGIQIQSMAVPSTLTMTRSLVEDTVEAGVLGASSTLQLDQTLIRRTTARSDGFFGDGVSSNADYGPTTIELRRSFVSDNARVGLMLFGGSVQMSENAFRCNPVHIDGEQEFSVSDGGGNSCGCADELEPCRVSSTGLAPPSLDGG